MNYLFTLLLSIILLFFQSPYLGPGDSAEYVLLAKTWSIAHPPGYPLYSLLTKLFALIPYSTISWRVALISSLSTIATAFFILKICQILNIKKYYSYVGALFYCFLFPVWYYSSIPEVFTLSNFFITVITYLLIKNYQQPQIKYLYTAAVFVGLCLSHHHTFVLFIPGWLYLIKKSKIKLDVQNYLTSTIIILFGLIFYIYPIIASWQYPPLDWENAKTLTGLIRIFFRASYGTFKSMSGLPNNIVNQFLDAFALIIFLFQDFKPLGIFFVILGYFSLFKKNKNYFWFFMINLIIHSFFLFYTNFNLNQTFGIALYERFLIFVYLNLIFPFIFGIKFFSNKFKLLATKLLKNDSLLKIVILFVNIFFILVVLITFQSNVATIWDQRNNSYFDNYAKDLLDTIPKGGIISANNDTSYFVTAAYNLTLKYRPDIFLISPSYLNRPHYKEALRRTYPSLITSKKADLVANLEEFLNKNYKRGIYFETPPAIGIWRQVGLLSKYYPDEKAALKDKDKLLKLNDYFWNKKYTIPEINKTNEKILHLQVIQNHYLAFLKNYSRLLIENGEKDKAKKVLERMLNFGSPEKINIQFILLNFNVFNKDCQEAKILQKKLSGAKYKENKLLLEAMLDYYTTCEPKNIELKIIKNQLKRINLNENLQLNNF